jgi:hypothetical protein
MENPKAVEALAEALDHINAAESALQSVLQQEKDMPIGNQFLVSRAEMHLRFAGVELNDLNT